VAGLTVVFYISGHGFGHASRSIEIINALIDRRPDLDVVVRSSVAPWLVERTARTSVSLSQAEVDTGVVQLDSLRLDAAESIRRAESFMATLKRRIEAEVAFLRHRRAAMTVSDLPALGIAAGNAAGLPAIATGNFTWDWIYEHYAGGSRVARQIADVYRWTTLALRLPMWGGFASMPKVLDIPLVARRSTRDPADVRAALDIPNDRRVVLASFGVLLPGTIDESVMYERGFRYEDLVRAVDVVVTKPGYGIISECIVNDTALLYTSRGDFREYQVLVDGMQDSLRCAFIDHPDLFDGNWAPHLDALLAQPARPTPRTDGADVAADILLDILG
jgi:hypothetical protein